MIQTASSPAPSIDPQEIEQFSALAERWWDPSGPMAPLHRMNPTRLAWIRDEITACFGRDITSVPAFGGLRLLDVGCGAGLVSEPMRRLGAEVVGIDPAVANIEAARLHAGEQDLAIDYRADTVEDLAEAGDTFDVVLALEVVEHVVDMPAFVATCAGMVRPGGVLIASTINRTMKAYMLAIVGAEYVLRWLPRGTHAYDKLVTPDELTAALTEAGLRRRSATGLMYVPIADAWRLTPSLDVNYMISATR